MSTEVSVCNENEDFNEKYADGAPVYTSKEECQATREATRLQVNLTTEIHSQEQSVFFDSFSSECYYSWITVIVTYLSAQPCQTFSI